MEKPTILKWPNFAEKSAFSDWIHSNIHMASITELQKIASQVRRDIIRMVSGAASGHPGGSLGAADILVALYFEIMKPDPQGFHHGRNRRGYLFPFQRASFPAVVQCPGTIWIF